MSLDIYIACSSPSPALSWDEHPVSPSWSPTSWASASASQRSPPSYPHRHFLRPLRLPRPRRGGICIHPQNGQRLARCPFALAFNHTELEGKQDFLPISHQESRSRCVANPSKKPYSLCHCRPFGCPELVSPRACLHGRSKVQQGIRSLSASRLPRRPKPSFWCSIGVLYFQINQFRDALDAYSRAIRINPYISEVWFDLGSLYESCNNQISNGPSMLMLVLRSSTPATLLSPSISIS